MSDTDDNYIGILLEEIRDQNKAVLEAVGGMRQELKRVPKREEFDDLKHDVKTIKTAVKATNKDLTNLDTRVTILEQASV